MANAANMKGSNFRKKLAIELAYKTNSVYTAGRKLNLPAGSVARWLVDEFLPRADNEILKYVEDTAISWKNDNAETLIKEAIQQRDVNLVAKKTNTAVNTLYYWIAKVAIVLNNTGKFLYNGVQEEILQEEVIIASEPVDDNCGKVTPTAIRYKSGFKARVLRDLFRSKSLTHVAKINMLNEGTITGWATNYAINRFKVFGPEDDKALMHWDASEEIKEMVLWVCTHGNVSEACTTFEVNLASLRLEVCKYAIFVLSDYDVLPEWTEMVKKPVAATQKQVLKGLAFDQVELEKRFTKMEEAYTQQIDELTTVIIKLQDTFEILLKKVNRLERSTQELEELRV